jgi:L-asparagine oxygenase
MNISAAVQSAGYAFLRMHSPTRPTADVAAQFGQVAALPSMSLVQQLTPKRMERASPVSYSGNYGLGHFPLHTDFAHWCRPPRYLLLRCVVGSSDVSTQLLDGHTLISAVGPDRLARTLVRPRRPLNGQRPLLRITDRVNDRATLLRWDFLFIRPATAFSASVYGEIVAYLLHGTPTEVFLASPGDTLIIDNWRMLHGRSSVIGRESDRLIERAYLGELH